MRRDAVRADEADGTGGGARLTSAIIIRRIIVAVPPSERRGERLVTTATDIFVNGAIGVFTGIAVLYVLMRVLAAALGRPAPESAPADPASD